MGFDLTPKQQKFLFYEGKRLNFLSGSVRSGKTFVSILKWCLWIADQPQDRTFLMVGKTIGSLKRNCFGYITQLIGPDNFKFYTNGKVAYIFGRLVYLEGANDERSEQKIRGMTLAGAYCDEVTLFPESFFSMLLSRLSVPGAKLWATCNPDNPNHYIKTQYIDRADELNCICWNFTLIENTFLPAEYIDAVSKEYTGVFYDRFILGRWVKAEGLIYPFFDEFKHTFRGTIPPKQQGCEYYVSIDYGTMNPTAMLLWCVDFKQHIAFAINEYYYNGRTDGDQKTDSEYYEALCKLTEGYNIEAVIVDPSSSSFITEIRKRGRFNVMKGKNDVLEGVRTTGNYIKEGSLKIGLNCVNTLGEIAVYSWKENKLTVQKDEINAVNDHAMDAMRYFCYTVLKRMDW